MDGIFYIFKMSPVIFEYDCMCSFIKKIRLTIDIINTLSDLNTKEIQFIQTKSPVQLRLL